MLKLPRKHIVLLTISAILWGITIPVIKYTSQFISPFAFLTLRLTLASIMTLPILIVLTAKSPTLKRYDALKIVLLSLCGQTIHLSFVFVGLNHTSAYEAAMLSAVCPVFTIITGVLILREHITKTEVIGLSVILTGALLTFIDSLGISSLNSNGHLYGNTLIILGGVAWTIFAILSKDIFRRYNPVLITLFSFYVGSISFLPLLVFEYTQGNFMIDLPSALPGIIYVAIGSSILAYLLYEMGLKMTEASEADLFSYLIPLFALIPSYLIFKEDLPEYILIGGALIILGIIITQRNWSKIRTHTRRGHI